MKMEPYGALKEILQVAKKEVKEMAERLVDNFVHLKRIKKVYRFL